MRRILPSCILMLIQLALNTAGVLIWGEFALPGSATLVAVLFTGVVEETIFRWVPLALTLRYCKTHHRSRRVSLNTCLISTVVASSLVFGAAHIMNLSAGASLEMTLIQSVAAVCVGVFFSAVYLRTGHIIFPIVFHILSDFIASCDSSLISESLTITGNLHPGVFLDYAFAAVLCVGGVLILISALRDIKFSSF